MGQILNNKIWLIVFFFAFYLFSTQTLLAQNKTQELNLKLTVYIGAEDEATANFESASFFLLEKKPVSILREMKLEESFIETIENSSENRKTISDDLYLKAASLILSETDKTQPLSNHITGWNYIAEDEKIDEDLEILSFVVNSKLNKSLISEIRFDNLIPNHSLKVSNQELYLFGFCRVGAEILVWNMSLSRKERDVALDQYNAEFIFNRNEFEQETDKL